MLASDHTGADTTTPADAHGYSDFAGAPAVRKVEPTPPPQTGITGMETMLQRLLPAAPGNAGSGLAVATWSRSQRLDYDSVFLVWQIGPQGGQVPGIG